MARHAAALLLSRAGAVSPGSTRPPWQVLRLLAAEPASARLLQQWLQAEPLPYDEDEARLAVEYVFAHEVRDVLAERSRWSVIEPVRHDIALALAWRLLGDMPTAAIDAAVPGLPEWYFVRWASGAEGRREDKLADPLLEQAAQLLQAGRLRREVLREVIEQALWSRRSHPGLGAFEAHTTLVRDLLVTGSLPGNKYRPLVPAHERYRPGGLGDEDAFFEVAVEAFDFLSQPTPPIPPQYRLQ